MKIFIDGAYYSEENARVSVLDHGFLYGDGVFEGIRVYGGRVFKLEEHIDRLFASAHTIRLEIPYTKEELTDHVLETCRENELDGGYVRLVVSRGAGDLGLDVDHCDQPTVVIIAADISLYPDELYEQGMAIMTVPTRRNTAETVNPQIKSLNYLNNILAKMEASLNGYNEALMLDDNGFVLECTGDNVFIVRDDVLITPPRHLGILPGITRNTVLELAQKRGISQQELPFTRHEVYNARECFLTGSAAEVIPIVKVDGRQIDDGTPGPVTEALIEDFRRYVRQTGEAF